MKEKDLEIQADKSNDSQFYTKEGHKMTKSLNQSKDKLIIKLDLE